MQEKLAGRLIWTIRYEGYDPISQVPSELTAIGAPTRELWARLGWIYTVLVTAFGWGLWKSAGRHRAVRIVGGLILAYASLALLWPFADMHQREVLAAGGGTLKDTMHVVLGGVTVFLTFLAIGFGAAAFGSRFRLYSIASIVVLLVFGALGRCVMKASLVVALGAAMAVPAFGLFLRYRRDLNAARAPGRGETPRHLDAMGCTVAWKPSSPDWPSRQRGREKFETVRYPTEAGRSDSYSDAAPMPCPQCKAPTPRLLGHTSKDASVWYYRCDTCGHVWTTPKWESDGPISHVTIKPKE